MGKQTPPEILSHAPPRVRAGNCVQTAAGPSLPEILAGSEILFFRRMAL